MTAAHKARVERALQEYDKTAAAMERREPWQASGSVMAAGGGNQTSDRTAQTALLMAHLPYSLRVAMRWNACIDRAMDGVPPREQERYQCIRKWRYARLRPPDWSGLVARELSLHAATVYRAHDSLLDDVRWQALLDGLLEA